MAPTTRTAALSAVEGQRRRRANVAQVSLVQRWTRQGGAGGFRAFTAQAENSASPVPEVERIATQLAAIHTPNQGRNDRTFAEATRQRDAARQYDAECPAHPQDGLRPANHAPFAAADRQFTKRFSDNPFGFACTVCERLWFTCDLRDAPARAMQCLRTMYPGRESFQNFRLCANCRGFLCNGKVPLMSTSNLSKPSGHWLIEYMDNVLDLQLVTNEKLYTTRSRT